MPSIVELERAALRLRHHLKTAILPDLKLLCGMRFFASFPDNDFPGRESYLREFIPELAEAAGKSHPNEFLPEEQKQIAKVVTLLSSQPEEIVSANDKSAFDALCAEFNSLPAGDGRDRPGRVAAVSDRGRPPADESARVRCLFVEHNPDLDLPPRGRVLNLRVTASHISSRTADDDIVVRNPVNEPDDRFLEQARQSVVAARDHLSRRSGLSQKKRYRLDFVIDSTGARFTGDSLGVAFAVGAIAAIGKVEVFRERLTISDEVAFTGALTPEGKLASIDGSALRLKIYRAFHSDLKYLVIPREHITEAWQYASELEAGLPGRRLELVGAESLDAVVSDPRLIPSERSSMPAHLARKAWQAKRSTWVEIPALLILALILFYILAPTRWMPWFDDNPVFVRIERRGFSVHNRDSISLWTVDYGVDSILQNADFAIGDINHDTKNEVGFLPEMPTSNPNPANADLFIYDYEGQSLFERDCNIIGRYPDDTLSEQHYIPGDVAFIESEGQTVIVTTVLNEYPARTHIRTWSSEGDSLGWYINSGFCGILAIKDIDQDGRPELIFGGPNNRMNCAALLVLPIKGAMGVSPPYQNADYDLSGVIPGNQTHYVLFPRSLVCKMASHLYNSIEGVYSKGEGVYRCDVVESRIPVTVPKGMPTLSYYLDSEFVVYDVKADDAFHSRWRDLARQGKVPDNFGPHLGQLLDSVRYWSGDGWVTSAQSKTGLSSPK